MTRKRRPGVLSVLSEAARNVWSQGPGQLGLLILAAAPMFIGIDAIVGSFPELVQHLIITVLAVSGVELVARALAESQSKAATKQALRDVLKEDAAVSGPARELGISAIFPDRRSAVPSILRDLEAAEENVLVLGVTFSEELKLDAILQRVPPGVRRVRVALLDPLRSTAVFRTYLEAEPRRRDSIHRAEAVTSAHPYFEERLYSDFLAAMTDFAHIDDRTIAHEGVRFYRHDPSCWMIVADDLIYFQPYTFGRTNASPGLLMGSQMPVFKITRSAGSPLYESLVDHFERLWKTSNTDHFHMDISRIEASQILGEVLEERRPWLDFVHLALSAEDLRAAPRRKCRAQGLFVEFLPQNGERSGTVARGEVCDYSRTGLLVHVSSDGHGLSQGDIVDVAVTGTVEPGAAELLVQRLLPEDRSMRVASVREGGTRVALSRKEQAMS